MAKSTTRIVALDIETDIPMPKGSIEMCEPFLLGIKHYRVESGRLIPEEYLSFEAGSFAEGVIHVAKTRGLIVGYNLFDFDYVVLRKWLEGTTIVERTVDPLRFLRSLPEKPRGLRLHSVCTQVLGEGKLELQLDALATWQAGSRDLVLRYNERDCDLVANLWFFLQSAKVLRIGGKACKVTAASRRLLATGGQFAGYEDWLTQEFAEQPLIVRCDPFVGPDVNPLDLAREFDRFVCQRTGNTFYSRFIPASDYPSGEDVGERTCPLCGEYLFQSPYVFKGPGFTRGGYLPASIEVEALWRKLDGEVVMHDFGPHFATTGIPRHERRESRLEDYLGIDEDDFKNWVRQIHSKDLQVFIPQYERQVQYFHHRSLRAEEEYALKIGII